ncbi:MAG: hypothetical protein ACOVP7_04195 [Lacibacter sp.]
MKKVVLFGAYLLFTVCTHAQTIMGRQIAEQFPKNSSGTLTYALTWLPQTYSSTTRSYPLIISLHGAGETGTTEANLSKLYTSSPRAVAGRIADGWNAVAVNPTTGVQDSFIVVSPQAASWSYSYTELKYILPAILNKYRIDRSRIYLVGLSAGGGGTYSTFGSRDSLFIKNFAAMATASSAGTNASNGYTAVEVETGLRYGSGYGVKIWTIAGEADYLLTTDVRYHDSTNTNNPAIKNKLTVVQGVGHSAWGKAYDPAFRPVVNYYGKTGTCNNGCAYGGVPVAPNTNGSSVRGTGVTQDSLNLYEWLLLWQRPETNYSPNVGDYRSNAAKPTGGKWSSTASWRRFDGANWVTTSTLPGAAVGSITIRANDSIDVDAAVTADQLLVESGAVLHLSGSAVTVNDGPGTDVQISGIVNLTNTASLTGTGTAGVNGTFNWMGGSLSVVTVTESGSVVNVSGSSAKTLAANLTSNGTFNWGTAGAGGDIQINNARFINNGLLNETFSANKGFTNGGGTVAFINNGTFKKLSVNTFSNGGVNFSNAGILQGVGAFNFSGTVTNTGTIKPGNSPGILTVSGAVVAGQNSEINIGIYDGSGAGTGHNRLDMTGNVNLAGNDLVVTENPAAPFQSYVILTTSGSFSGTFANTSLPDGYVITYNPQTISVSKAQGTLPAVWGSFEVLLNGKNAMLNWSTLQEENTSYFEVEYAVNGTSFATLARVNAAGNSQQQNNYQFIHRNPSAAAVNYYRIKLIDLDGKISYSAVKTLKLKEDQHLLRILSNTVTDQLQLSVQQNGVQIVLIDMTGRVFYNETVNAGVQQINTSNFAKGLYRLIVRNGKTIEEVSSFVKY